MINDESEVVVEDAVVWPMCSQPERVTLHYLSVFC